MRALALCVLLACAKRVDTASSVEQATHAEQASVGEVRVLEHGTRSSGPVDVVTVTEEWGPAGGDRSESSNSAILDVKTPDQVIGSRTQAPAPLIRRITRTEHRGPVEATRDRATQAEAATAATQDARVTARAEGHETSGWSPPWWLWLACLAIGAGALYWRLR